MFGCFGRAEAIGHVGELLQGALRLRGVAEPFLITLPAPELRSVASVESAAAWSVWPGTKTKALRAAILASRYWRWPGQAHLRIESAIPEGRGFGSSTADCVAAIRAVAVMTGAQVSGEEAGKLAVMAEKASDSTMFDSKPVVFLPLRGRCLRQFEGGWPVDLRLKILDLGGPSVDTCSTERPSYSSTELDEFEELISRAAGAFARCDAVELARISTRSAEIHIRHRPHARWQWLRERAAADRALGVALSHSGTVAAILTQEGACR